MHINLFKGSAVALKSIQFNSFQAPAESWYDGFITIINHNWGPYYIPVPVNIQLDSNPGIIIITYRISIPKPASYPINNLVLFILQKVLLAGTHSFKSRYHRNFQAPIRLAIYDYNLKATRYPCHLLMNTPRPPPPAHASY